MKHLDSTCGDFPECHDESWPCGHVVVARLIAQGADYAIAEDKAFMAEDSEAEAMAHGGMEATVKALALVMNTDEAHAAQTILTHV